MISENKKCLIVGAGEGGRELLEQLLKNKSLGFDIVGFIDDNFSKKEKKIQGFSILGKINQLSCLVEKYGINHVFIAIPSAQGSLIRFIIEQCQKAKVAFRIIPRTVDIIQGHVPFESIREVRIDDILGRAILKSDLKKIKKVFCGKRILISGAAGSIGSELCRQTILLQPKSLIMFDWWENGLFEIGQEFAKIGEKNNFEIVVGNIQDRGKMEWVYKTFHPDIILHAAAFKHVPLMEAHPEEAVRNNILGTMNMAELAGQHNAEKFIMISTDKAVNPSSVMGATKAFAELLVRHFNSEYRTEYSSVRFGNVVGSNGSAIPLFQKQILAGGPVTVTHPRMTRYFMTIPEAAQLVLQAVKLGRGGEIFILDMGEPIKIIELVKTMIRLAGFKPETEIPIKIIGTRPGEKIIEIVLTKDEKKEKTKHDLIYVTENVLNISGERIMESYQKIITLMEQHDRSGIIKELFSVLPTYKKRII